GMLRHAGLEAHQPTSPGFVHRIAEAAKLAMADRLAWYGDPRFADVPAQGLLDADYLRSRAQLIGAQASRQMRAGSIGGR
ncbi:gamma-glutamyltransferase, partial [Acinetobacter baumannii]